MANPVERLRYFDREYLRSYDFTDEQSYHIAMRRLMNRKLHLHGIIYGLEIVQDQDSVPASGIYFFSIAPGMAIDDAGREINVLAPYSLSDVLTGPNLNAGKQYDVWICYAEKETGLPAAGYMDCNAPSQYTRWQEYFQVQLIPVVGPSVVARCDGVRLGTVTLQPSPAGLGLAIVDPPDVSRRHYVGIRAQRVVAPDEEPDPFDLTRQNIDPTKRLAPAGYLDIQPSGLERGNLIVEKNQVIGDDFVLDNTTYKNLPKDFSSIPTGNLKITRDLFVNGDCYFYSTDDATWYKHKQLIQSVMPRIVTGNISITLPTPNDSGAKPSTSIPVQSNQFASFPAGGTTQIILGISEMDLQDPKIQGFWAGLGPTTVQLGTPAINPSTPTYSTLNVTVTIGPVADNTTANQYQYPLTKLVLSYVIIYQP